jgi:hypothetical protein
MRDLARLTAALLAFAVVARDFAVAGDSVAMRTATYLLLFVVLAALTLWRDGAVTVSALALGAHYVVSLGYGHVDVDLAAPVMAALVVAYLDVADLAMSLPRDHRVDRALALVSLRRLATVVGIGALAGAAAYAIAAAPLPRSNVVRNLDITGVALAVAAPISLVRRQ